MQSSLLLDGPRRGWSYGGCSEEIGISEPALIHLLDWRCWTQERVCCSHSWRNRIGTQEERSNEEVSLCPAIRQSRQGVTRAKADVGLIMPRRPGGEAGMTGTTLRSRGGRPIAAEFSRPAETDPALVARVTALEGSVTSIQTKQDEQAQKIDAWHQEMKTHQKEVHGCTRELLTIIGLIRLPASLRETVV